MHRGHGHGLNRVRERAWLRTKSFPRCARIPYRRLLRDIGEPHLTTRSAGASRTERRGPQVGDRRSAQGRHGTARHGTQEKKRAGDRRRLPPQKRRRSRRRRRSSPMANPMFDDDDFDFGGDDGDEAVKSAGKRAFLELEDDDEDADLYPAKKMYATSAGGNDHATTTILNLRASLEERDSTIANLKKDLTRVNGDVERWRTTFQDDSVSSVITNPEPDVVLEAFQKLLGSEGRLKEQLVTAKGQVATLLVKISGKEQEILDLKSLAHDLRISLKPPMLQARRLLLDPAVHAEFTRMKKELETSEKKVKELQDDLAAVQFTPHSKNGKMLMAKCRTLQEENEEIGREASEGKMYEVSTKLAMQKALTQELKRGYHELYEYVEDLNYEAEQSQQAIYMLQRQIQHRDHQLQAQLLEQTRQTEAREVSVKSKEEERGQQPESARDSHGGDGDSHDKPPSGESRRR